MGKSEGTAKSPDQCYIRPVVRLKAAGHPDRERTEALLQIVGFATCTDLTWIGRAVLIYLSIYLNNAAVTPGPGAGRKLVPIVLDVNCTGFIIALDLA